jgi:hypothetical protein
VRPNTELTCLGTETHHWELKLTRISDRANVRYSARDTHTHKHAECSVRLAHSESIRQFCRVHRPTGAHTRLVPAVRQSTASLPARGLPYILGNSHKPRRGQATPLCFLPRGSPHGALTVTQPSSDGMSHKRNTAKHRMRINYGRISLRSCRLHTVDVTFGQGQCLRPTTSKDTTRIARAHQHSNRERHTRHA